MNGDICVSSGKRNPLEEGLKLDEFDKTEPEGDWPFRELVGCLMWLVNQTRPDIGTAVRAVARYTNSPTGRLQLVFSLSPGFCDERLIWENDGIFHDLVRYLRCFYCLTMIFEIFRFHFSNESLMVDDTKYTMSWKYEIFGTWGRQRLW